ncbi:MAG TPA: sugar nucleotide-binding protein [Candidatus Hydrogenedentes bacterium]|nr:sugar nucleotide-binding protein [Candidatus Hydrogenedentota bacterium]HPG66739.1 sugar nucleotide-binding protein [Candidatus Hydrogenedentota bacterium]
MESLLITGARGFIAGSILAQSADGSLVHAQSRGEPVSARNNIVWHTFDPLDVDILDLVFRSVAPDAVIHTAAVAGIDYCQAHRDEAERVNVVLTQAIAERCASTGAKMVFLSTDNVFDGERGAYTEDDPPSPIHFYGETKVKAEEAVAAALDDYVIARVAVVMGLPMLGTGNSFLSRMIPTLDRGEPLGVPPDEIRTPIDVVTAGRALLELAGNDVTGLIHLAGNDTLPRIEVVRRIAQRMGFSPDLVVPNDPTVLPGRAPRPRDCSLANSRARAVLRTPMLDTDQAIGLILDSRT